MAPRRNRRDTVAPSCARKLLAKGEDIEAVLEALSRGLTQKMLHGTLAELRSADAEQRAQLGATVSRLFLRGATREPGEAGPADDR